MRERSGLETTAGTSRSATWSGERRRAQSMLALAAAALAVLAYRDAATHGSRLFDRQDPAAVGTVLALLPQACDSQDQAFRAGVARALWDLADDLSHGRAPLPRSCRNAGPWKRWGDHCVLVGCVARGLHRDRRRVRRRGHLGLHLLLRGPDAPQVRRGHGPEAGGVPDGSPHGPADPGQRPGLGNTIEGDQLFLVPR